MATDKQNGTNDTRAHIRMLCTILLLNSVVLCLNQWQTKIVCLRFIGTCRIWLVCAFLSEKKGAVCQQGLAAAMFLVFSERNALIERELGFANILLYWLVHSSHSLNFLAYWLHFNCLHFLTPNRLKLFVILILSAACWALNRFFLGKTRRVIMALKWFIASPSRLENIEFPQKWFE